MLLKQTLLFCWVNFGHLTVLFKHFEMKQTPISDWKKTVFKSQLNSFKEADIQSFKVCVDIKYFPLKLNKQNEID